jgi:hypothetical protein
MPRQRAHISGVQTQAAALIERALKLQSTMIPRVSNAGRPAPSPDLIGLIIYNTQIERLQLCTGQEWRTLNS